MVLYLHLGPARRSHPLEYMDMFVESFFESVAKLNGCLFNVLVVYEKTGNRHKAWAYLTIHLDGDYPSHIPGIRDVLVNSLEK